MKLQNRWRMNIKALAAGFGIALFTCHPLLADDTEIFFGGAGGANAVHPNVLFVLDTSSSMTNTDVTNLAGQTVSRLDAMKEALHTILDDATDVNVGLMRFSKPGGPVLFPISYIDEDACNVVGCDPIIQARVAASSDDAEEDGSENVDLTGATLEMVYRPAVVVSTVSFTTDEYNNDVEEYNTNDLYEYSTDLEFFRDGSGRNPQRIGLRFPGVNIPSGATVTDAYLRFTVDENGSGSVSADIYGHAHADSPTFSTSGIRGVSDRIASEAVATQVDWNSIPNPSVGATVTTPPVTAIVQEIRATASWVTGNPMTFMIVADPSMTVDNSNRRIFEAGENGTVSSRPTLVITYSEPSAGGATLQTIGLRFADVQIPQGVTITSAVVEFEAASVDSGAAALVIDIEASDNAASFSDTAPDQVSDRTLGGLPVTWGAAPWTTPGATEQSPSITSLVQAVVSRPGWCGGNAMALVISGSGTRSARSYDQTPGGAPVLKVTYDPNSMPAGGGCMTKSIVKRVATGSDDAEQDTSDNSVSTGSSDLEMMVDAGNDQFIGLRFQRLDIPQGATITNAYLQFTTKDSGSSGTIDMSIYGEDTDDAATFSTGSNNIGSRALTSAVDWVSYNQTNVDETLTTTTDPNDANNLKSVVQAIVNRNGWSSGNNMAFIIKKDSGTGVRRMRSHNNSPGKAAKLYVEAQWDATAGGSTPIVTVRQLLKQTVDDIQYKSWTPIVGTLYEAARYYRGEGVEFGNQRGDGGARERTRVSHPATYTGGTVNRSGLCTDADLSHADCATESISGSPVYTSPITATCQESFIILLTDGAPSVNEAEVRIKNNILGAGSSCANSGGSKACGPELTAYLRDNDQIGDATLQGMQRITTHTIGFAFSGSWLDSLATNGGGTPYTATDAASLVTAFNTILASVANVDTSFVAPGATVNAFNRLNHRNEIFFSLFKPEETHKWGGNLKKYQILNGEIADVNGAAAVEPNTGFFKDTAQSYWSTGPDGKDVSSGGAAGKLTQTGRKVYTYTGANGSIATGGVALNAAAHKLSETNPAILDDSNGDGDLDDAGEKNLVAAADTVEATNILKWARGVDVKDYDDDGDLGEDRKEMGDPLHSAPVIVTYGGTDADPELVVFVATNEGYLHAIVGGSALTSPRPILEPGREIFSFVPKELLPNLAKFYHNTSSGDRPYGLDGEITSWVIESNDADHTIEPADGDKVYLYIGMRRGGKNYYALDVTDLDAPKLMWVLEGDSGTASDPRQELGQTWSRPIKTRIRIDVSGISTKKDVLIFGGGYDTANDDDDDTSPPARTNDAVGRAIYIVDALTGDILWSGGINNGTIDHDEYFSKMTHSIPSDLRVIDINGDAIADFMYAADTGGQIWRFDIHNGNAAADLVTGGVMADLSDEVSATAANNRRLYYEPDASLVGYGGSQYIALAIGSGWRAHPLDEVVDDRLYMIRDYAIYGAPLGYGITADGGTSYNPITESDLYDATDNDIGEAIGQDLIDAKAALAGAAGWYVRLENSGEKSLARATTFQGETIFTTYEPTASLQTCTAALGTGRAYMLNTADATPVRNNYDPINSSDNELTKEDRTYTFSRGGIPPSATVFFPEDSETLILGGMEDLGGGSGRKVERLYWLERETE